MKMKLAVALVVLFFASQAHADGIETSEGFLTIPDGSTVTSLYAEPGTEPADPWEPPAVYVVDYSFAGGTGSAQGSAETGYEGVIDFSSPVTDLTFGWFGDPLRVGDNAGDSFLGIVITGGQETFSGPDITQVTWYSDFTAGGITSLSYVVESTGSPASLPEPSSLILSGIGLAALIGLKLKAWLTRSSEVESEPVPA
jgi:hypothetical protein